MKKLLTLFTLLLCVCSGAWGTDLTATYDVASLISASTLSSSSTNDDFDQTIDQISFDFSKGSGTNIVVNSSRVRVWQDNGTGAITISPASGYTIKSVAFTVGNKNNSPTGITNTGTGTWSPAFTSSAISNSTYTFSPTTPTAGTSYSFGVYKSSTSSTCRIDFSSIVVTYELADTRDAAPISWSASSAKAVLNKSNSFPTLTNTEDLAVTYASSNTSAATINASTGEISLVAKGSTTISATYTSPNAQAAYRTTKVSYELTVSNVTAIINKDWNFTEDTETFTGSNLNTTIDNLEIVNGSFGTRSKTFTNPDESTIDLTQILTINAGSSNYVHFAVSGPCKIASYVYGNGSSRKLGVYAGSISGTELYNESVGNKTPEVHTAIYSGTDATDIYMYNPGSNALEFFRILVSPLKCGTPTFSPNGGSIEEGGSVTITSTDAATIKYAWTADNVDTPDSWTSADATDDAIIVTVPNAADNTPRLHAYGIKSGYTDGDVAYVDFSITGVDTTAPTLTAQSVENNATDVTVADNITLTFDENVQVADASKVTLTGGEATISSVTAEDNVVTIAYTGLENNTTYTLAVASGAITDVAAAQNAYAGTSFSFTTEKASMPAPKINGLGYFIGSQTVSITSDVDGATITYSLDGENYSAYTEPFEITDSKTVYAKATHTNYSGEGSAQLAMYIISVPASQEDVTTSTTWDFTDADDMKPSSEVANNPIPTTELASTVSIYTSEDKAAQISFIMPQRYDAGGYVQAHGFIITSTVPGKLSVNFTNGNSNTRYLIVNGVKKGQISSNGANVTVNDIEIPIGTTIVYGFDVTNNPNAVNNLRYKKIIFTPVTSVSGTITEAGWNTFSCNYALDLSTITGGTAYVAKTNDNTEVTMTKTTAKIAAGTGIMIKGNAGETFTISTTTDAATLEADNQLVGLPNGGTVAANAYNFVFAWETGDVSTAGFYYVDIAAPTLPAGKAYLNSEGVNGAKLSIVIDDTPSQEETDGIRSIENSELRMENSNYYNLSGQKVGADYKGIVIVNGKKVIRK